MKRPSQLLAWLILKPLGVACQNGGAIAFYVVEKDFLQEHCGSETAQELWTMFTPRLVASTLLLCKSYRISSEYFPGEMLYFMPYSVPNHLLGGCLQILQGRQVLGKQLRHRRQDDRHDVQEERLKGLMKEGNCLQ